MSKAEIPRCRQKKGILLRSNVKSILLLSIAISSTDSNAVNKKSDRKSCKRITIDPLYCIFASRNFADCIGVSEFRSEKQISLVFHCVIEKNNYFHGINNSFSPYNYFWKHFQIRAAIPIRKGEHISISYTDPMWGTANRQHHLYETKFFRCRCARCLDPTEMNTDFSSLRCPSCSIERPGYLTPSEPLDHTKSWQCDVCKKTEPANYVSAVIRSIGEELVCFKEFCSSGNV